MSISQKLLIFSTDILWKSCSEYKIEQLSHNMSCKNINSLAVAKENVYLGYVPLKSPILKLGLEVKPFKPQIACCSLEFKPKA